uniref:Uncharacterized protein n=1 Tax=Physcomitrium patens TaxID=3218 RepID=A0A2K1IE45_PHYPA|nr:hypothetical protein PHYPA_029700 [Physcomitrium patens]
MLIDIIDESPFALINKMEASCGTFPIFVIFLVLFVFQAYRLGVI